MSVAGCRPGGILASRGWLLQTKTEAGLAAASAICFKAAVHLADGIGGHRINSHQAP
jgi:hypothetical protein